MKLSDLYWHRVTPLHLLLWPLSLLFNLFLNIRKLCYWLDFFPSVKLPVPVIVVDSITTDDGGKTPFVSWLIRTLLARGLCPGIVTQGGPDHSGQPGGRVVGFGSGYWHSGARIRPTPGNG